MINHIQKLFLLIGPPAVGKSTYATLLQRDLALLHISIPHQIRNILKKQSAAQLNSHALQTIRHIVRTGGLITSDIILSILREEMSQQPSSRGFLLNGFPQTQQQFELMQKQFTIDGALNITMRDDILLQRLMGRRTCVDCGRTYNLCRIQRDGYHIQPLVPKKQGVCDFCQNILQTREDDNQKIIQVKLKQYKLKSEPLLHVLQKKGLLINFQAKTGIRDYPQILKLVQSKI